MADTPLYIPLSYWTNPDPINSPAHRAILESIPKFQPISFPTEPITIECCVTPDVNEGPKKRSDSRGAGGSADVRDHHT